jgi:hypothetical protein
MLCQLTFTMTQTLNMKFKLLKTTRTSTTNGHIMIIQVNFDLEMTLIIDFLFVWVVGQTNNGSEMYINAEK